MSTNRKRRHDDRLTRLGNLRYRCSIPILRSVSLLMRHSLLNGGDSGRLRLEKLWSRCRFRLRVYECVDMRCDDLVGYGHNGRHLPNIHTRGRLLEHSMDVNDGISQAFQLCILVREPTAHQSMHCGRTPSGLEKFSSFRPSELQCLHPHTSHD